MDPLRPCRGPSTPCNPATRPGGAAGFGGAARPVRLGSCNGLSGRSAKRSCQVSGALMDPLRPCRGPSTTRGDQDLTQVSRAHPRRAPFHPRGPSATPIHIEGPKASSNLRAPLKADRSVKHSELIPIARHSPERRSPPRGSPAPPVAQRAIRRSAKRSCQVSGALMDPLRPCRGPSTTRGDQDLTQVSRAHPRRAPFHPRGPSATPIHIEGPKASSNLRAPLKADRSVKHSELIPIARHSPERRSPPRGSPAPPVAQRAIRRSAKRSCQVSGALMDPLRPCRGPSTTRGDQDLTQVSRAHPRRAPFHPRGPSATPIHIEGPETSSNLRAPLKADRSVKHSELIPIARHSPERRSPPRGSPAPPVAQRAIRRSAKRSCQVSGALMDPLRPCRGPSTTRGDQDLTQVSRAHPRRAPFHPRGPSATPIHIEGPKASSNLRAPLKADRSVKHSELIPIARHSPERRSPPRGSPAPPVAQRAIRRSAKRSCQVSGALMDPLRPCRGPSTTRGDQDLTQVSRAHPRRAPFHPRGPSATPIHIEGPKASSNLRAPLKADRSVKHSELIPRCTALPRTAVPAPRISRASGRAKGYQAEREALLSGIRGAHGSATTLPRPFHNSRRSGSHASLQGPSTPCTVPSKRPVCDSDPHRGP